MNDFDGEGIQVERVILASGSPRRKEILTEMGVDFEVHAADVDEECSLGAREAVGELARRKARAAAASFPGRVVLAADTLVALDDVPLGKPKDEADALRMLQLLSGRTHQVFTGVCVVDEAGGEYCGTEATDVRFERVPDHELLAYVRTGEPMDKAGAYAIQGGAGRWIPEIRGSRTNVIGLPRELTATLLEQAGVRGAAENRIR